MEPDGTGVWREIISSFNASHPGTPIRLTLREKENPFAGKKSKQR
jgi:hypothetical protein